MSPANSDAAPAKASEPFGKRRFYSQRGRDLVHECAHAGDFHGLSRLIADGGDPDSDDGDQPALEAAVESGSRRCVDLLIRSGAAVDPVAEGTRATLLMRIVGVPGKLAFAEALLRSGADPLAVDGWGWTPLHWAGASDSPGAVDLLERHGGLNERLDGIGRCALECALESGSARVCSALAEKWSLARLEAVVQGRSGRDALASSAADGKPGPRL